MKQREKENIISAFILGVMITLLFCWICPTQGHKPCGCDTCYEYHYNNIRNDNPNFNIPEIP